MGRWPLDSAPDLPPGFASSDHGNRVPARLQPEGLFAWPGAVAEMVDPGALDDLPRGGSAPFVPVSGGVHTGSLPEFDCHPPPVPLGGLSDPAPVPLGGTVEPVGEVFEPAPAPPDEADVDEADVPVAVCDPGSALGDDAPDRFRAPVGAWAVRSAGSATRRAPGDFAAASG